MTPATSIHSNGWFLSPQLPAVPPIRGVLAEGRRAQFEFPQGQALAEDNFKIDAGRNRQSAPVARKSGLLARSVSTQFNRFCRPSNACWIEISRGFGHGGGDRIGAFRPKKSIPRNQDKIQSFVNTRTNCVSKRAIVPRCADKIPVAGAAVIAGAPLIGILLPVGDLSVVDLSTGTVFGGAVIMRKCLVSLVVVFVSLWAVFTSTTARAEWPAKVFAPYMYLGSGDSFKLTECDDACGLKHYTLAFVIAQQEQSVDENGKKQARIVDDSSGHKVPAWDGRTPMEKDLYHEQIDAIRKRGGDVIVSFGGEAGKELALVIEDPAVLEKTYQSIIDRYKFTWLDFDIEGKALGDMKANERRNEVLAKLQAKNPGLRISFTVPVDPNGVSRETKAMLTDAKAKGVKVHSANVMTMYFGLQHVKDKKLADVCIASAKKAHEQTQAIDPAIQIGLCPMIGKGGDKGAEVFGLDDAKVVEEWAAQQPWVCSLSYWAINRDSGKPGKNGNTRSGIEQEPWAFAKIFDLITTK